MSIKILGGLAKGFPLSAPKNDLTRPTSVLVRRKLFDWRQNLEGYIFIDLCAGSGAVGLEALSRGASKVFMNDSQRPVFHCLKSNTEKFLRSFKLESSMAVLGQFDALKWLMKELPYQVPETEAAILYLDPPYEDHKIYEQALVKLKELGFAGEVWIESDRLKGPSKDKLTGALCSIIKTVDQGDHFVVVGKVV